MGLFTTKKTIAQIEQELMQHTRDVVIPTWQKQYAANKKHQKFLYNIRDRKPLLGSFFYRLFFNIDKKIEKHNPVIARFTAEKDYIDRFQNNGYQSFAKFYTAQSTSCSLLKPEFDHLFSEVVGFSKWKQFHNNRNTRATAESTYTFLGGAFGISYTVSANHPKPEAKQEQVEKDPATGCFGFLFNWGRRFLNFAKKDSNVEVVQETNESLIQ